MTRQMHDNRRQNTQRTLNTTLPSVCAQGCDDPAPSRRDFIRRSAAAAGLAVASAAVSQGALAGLAGASAGRQPEPSGLPLRVDPPTDKLNVLILGGTAFLGPQIVEELLGRGHTVTLFNRGKTNPNLFPDLEKLRGDRNGDLKSLEGRQWDAVIDTSGYTKPQAELSAGLLKDAVGHYVFISTISVYAGYAQAGMDESAPVAQLPPGVDENTTTIDNGTYGPLKALCERTIESIMPGRVTSIRPGLIVGPGDPTDRFTYWPVRVSRGGEVLAPGTPRDPVQFIDARDLAKWSVHAMEQKLAGVFNATGPASAMAMGELLDACRQACPESDAQFTWVEADFLARQGVSPWSDMPVWVPPAGEMRGFAAISAARAIAQGLTFRPVLDTCLATLKWWREEREKDAATPEKLRAGLTAQREAAVLKAWRDEGKK